METILPDSVKVLLAAAALLGADAVMCCGSGNDEGGIRPYAKNQSYWQYGGRPILLFGGSDRDGCNRRSDEAI